MDGVHLTTMTIYSLYVYDRHCECVFYHDWQRTNRPRPANQAQAHPGVLRPTMVGTKSALSSSSGIVVATGDGLASRPSSVPPTGASTNLGLPFDEEAKLVYGVVLSLKNMIKKLSGKDEAFVNYRTSSYKLHLWETLSGYRFILITDPQTAPDASRLVLRQIYAGPFIEFVVRNPLISMDSREAGIDNEHFRSATDKLVRNLSIFS